MSSSRALLIGLAWAPAACAAATVQCPAIHGGARLVTVTVFDGAPSGHADLMPDRFANDAKGGRSEWDVAYIYKAGRQLSVQCDYGGKILPVLLHPDPDTKTCVFLPGGAAGASLQCGAR